MTLYPRCGQQLLPRKVTGALRLLLAATAVFGLVLIGGCARKEENRPAAPENTPQAVVPEVIEVVERAGRAPDFTWKDASGKTVSFDSYRGRVTIVNFWATWCVPCKKEIPDLIALSNELAGRDVKILGVSTDRGLGVPAEVGSFVQQNGIPYQNIISSDDLESAFGNVRMIPTSFIIDADGKIAQTMVGIRTKDAFLQSILPLLK